MNPDYAERRTVLRKISVTFKLQEHFYKMILPGVISLIPTLLPEGEGLKHLSLQHFDRDSHQPSGSNHFSLSRRRTTSPTITSVGA
jgi:hypothetical protein